MNPDAIKIRDIKPLLEVPDHSIYIFIGLLVLAGVLLFGGAYLLFRWYRFKNKLNLRRETYKQLLHVDLSKPKEAAYEITKYGYMFKDDSPRNLEMYNNLTSRLQGYKYKKEVSALDEEVKSYFDLYKGMIDV